MFRIKGTDCCGNERMIGDNFKSAARAEAFIERYILREAWRDLRIVPIRESVDVAEAPAYA